MEQNQIIARAINSYEEMKDYQREQMREPRRYALLILLAMAVLHIFLAMIAKWNLVRLLPGMVVLMGIPFIAYLAFNGAFYTRRQHEQSSVLSARYVRFSGTGFEVATELEGDAETEVKYDQVDRVHETRFAFYLYLNNNLVYLVSKQGFQSGNAEELRSLLQSSLKAGSYTISGDCR